jgi:hypothetical protein
MDEAIISQEITLLLKYSRISRSAKSWSVPHSMSCTELQVEMMNSFLRMANEKSIEPSKESILNQISFILWDHPQLIDNCLGLLDDETKKIRRIKSATSTRVFWKVPSQSFRGSNQKDYTCTEKFCSCKSFFELAKTTRCDILCKHLVAIRIGTALNFVVEQVVNDTLFADMMCDWILSELQSSMKPLGQSPSKRPSINTNFPQISCQA